MDKKKTKFTQKEVETIAYCHIKKEKFGNVHPSDVDSNWNYGTISDLTGNGNSYGVYVRFALEVFCISFAELDFYPVFENTDKIVCYKHFEDLTEGEKKELASLGFLKKIS